MSLIRCILLRKPDIFAHGPLSNFASRGRRGGDTNHWAETPQSGCAERLPSVCNLEIGAPSRTQLHAQIFKLCGRGSRCYQRTFSRGRAQATVQEEPVGAGRVNGNVSSTPSSKCFANFRPPLRLSLSSERQANRTFNPRAWSRRRDASKSSTAQSARTWAVLTSLLLQFCELKSEILRRDRE